MVALGLIESHLLWDLCQGAQMPTSSGSWACACSRYCISGPLRSVGPTKGTQPPLLQMPRGLAWPCSHPELALPVLPMWPPPCCPPLLWPWPPSPAAMPISPRAFSVHPAVRWVDPHACQCEGGFDLKGARATPRSLR